MSSTTVLIIAASVCNIASMICVVYACYVLRDSQKQIQEHEQREVTCQNPCACDYCICQYLAPYLTPTLAIIALVVWIVFTASLLTK